MYKFADFIGAHLKVVVVEPNGRSKDPEKILKNFGFNMVVSQELAKFQNTTLEFLKDEDVEKDLKVIPCDAGLVLLPCLGKTSEQMHTIVKKLKGKCPDTHIVVWDDSISKKEEKALLKLGADRVFSDRLEAANLSNIIEVVKAARPDKSSHTLLSAN